tara:strand:- start:15839 stop:16336 length:498 start_codon:yes stop_codon:yes gene_type:complete
MSNTISAESTEPYLIEGKRFIDDRGSVSFVNNLDFSKAGIKRFYTIDHDRHMIRAFHGHKNESKYAIVTKGTFRIILRKMVVSIVDSDNLTHESPQIEFEEFILSGDQPKMLFIPKMYYNGFQNLTEKGSITFYSTSTLKESEGDDYRSRWDTCDEETWSLKKYR